MKARVLHEAGERTFAVVFDTDDEVIGGLLDFARRWKVTAARFTAIGAFRRVTLGYFEWERKDYRKIPIEEQVEVLTLAGDIAHAGGRPAVHAHVVVGKADGTAHGGHLLEAHVRPTLEVMLVESPAHLVRVHDDATGLALIRL
ncbi:MAG TPA: PPC domain-containing DNA-binding protein [Thermodesulfobacteriota bacterium]